MSPAQRTPRTLITDNRTEHRTVIITTFLLELKTLCSGSNGIQFDGVM